MQRQPDNIAIQESISSIKSADIIEAINFDNSLLTDKNEDRDKVNPLQEAMQPITQTRKSESTTLPFAQRNSLFENRRPVEPEPFVMGRPSLVPGRDSRGPMNVPDRQLFSGRPDVSSFEPLKPNERWSLT